MRVLACACVLMRLGGLVCVGCEGGAKIWLTGNGDFFGGGGREGTRGEIGLSLKNGVKCFCYKGLRW